MKRFLSAASARTRATFHRVEENEFVSKSAHTLSHVPSFIERPPMPLSIQASLPSLLQNESQISGIQRACEIARMVLDYACLQAEEGLTTDQLDRVVHQKIISLGAYPSPLGYHGFPKSICTSVNNILCHGIPDGRPLKNGDIINIDVTVFYKGYHGDTSKTLEIGLVDQVGRDLTQAARKAMEIGINQCGPGQKISDIGKAISIFSQECGFLSDPHFCGHGIGMFFHTAPTIQHVENDDHLLMKEGMIFTVEPILVEGLIGFKKWKDEWTCEALDG